MLIEVKCLCGQRFKVEDEKAGERVPCTACWRTLTIPVKIVLDAVPEPAVASAAPPAAEEPAAAVPEAAPKLVVKCLCGTVNEAALEMAGQRAPCSGCWRSVVYPTLEAVTPPAPPPRPHRTITLNCYCGKQLRVPSDLIGQEVQCPLCERMVTIPDPAARPAVDPAEAAAGTVAPEPPPRPSARDYLYWALLPLLVPVILNLFAPVGPSPIQRLEQTLKENPEVRQQLLQRYARRLPVDPTTIDLLIAAGWDNVLKALPDARLDKNAYLPRTSHMHWLYAGAAALGFFLLAVLLFVRNVDQARALLAVGLFTGTLGICLLLGVQEIVGIGMLTPLLLDTNADVVPRMLAFIFGVGFFEELFKALPLLWYFRFRGRLSWRDACLWGIASGAGFGISEGIYYSEAGYNGVAGSDAYLIRFASCVALHAVWSASVGISIARSHTPIKGGFDSVLEGTMPVWDWLLPLLRVLAIAMTLHGLYDTFVGHPKLDVWALMVALLSFAWLGWQIETCREEDQQALSALEGAKPAG